MVEFNCPARPRIDPKVVRPGTEFIDVVIGGVGYVETPDGREELREGAMLWSCEGERTLHLADPADPFYTLAVILETTGVPDRRPARVSRWGDVTMLRRFVHEWLAFGKDVHDAPEFAHYVYTTLYWHAVARPTEERQWPDALRRTVSSIRQAPGQYADVRQIAETVGVSTPYLHVLFKQYLHTTPYHFAMGERIRRAQVLLEITSLSAKEVGVDCGFESPVSFGRAFKRETGFTPLQYRRRHTGGSA